MRRAPPPAANQAPRWAVPAPAHCAAAAEAEGAGAGPATGQSGTERRLPSAAASGRPRPPAPPPNALPTLAAPAVGWAGGRACRGAEIEAGAPSRPSCCGRRRGGLPLPPPPPPAFCLRWAGWTRRGLLEWNRLKVRTAGGCAGGGGPPELKGPADAMFATGAAAAAQPPRSEGGMEGRTGGDGPWAVPSRADTAGRAARRPREARSRAAEGRGGQGSGTRLPVSPPGWGSGRWRPPTPPYSSLPQVTGGERPEVRGERVSASPKSGGGNLGSEPAELLVQSRDPATQLSTAFRVEKVSVPAFKNCI